MNPTRPRLAGAVVLDFRPVRSSLLSGPRFVSIERTTAWSISAAPRPFWTTC